jgi:copper chaperone CopZ
MGNIMQTEILRVTGMTGIDCVANITKALDAIAGVDDFNVSLAGSSVTVRYDERLVSNKEFQDALFAAGYPTAGQAAHADGSCCGSCGG